MLLTGTYPRTLDDKLRLALPKRLRDLLKGCNLYLAPSTDGSLGIYPESVFERLANRLSETSPVGHDVRTFSRLFFAQADALEFDAQGRIRLSQESAQLAGLQKEVMLLGVRDHLELWDRAKWEEYRRERQAQYDEIAERALDPLAAAKQRRAILQQPRIDTPATGDGGQSNAHDQADVPADDALPIQADGQACVIDADASPRLPR